MSFKHLFRLEMCSNVSTTVTTSNVSSWKGRFVAEALEIVGLTELIGLQHCQLDSVQGEIDVGKEKVVGVHDYTWRRHTAICHTA